MDEIHCLRLRQPADASDRSAGDYQRVFKTGGEQHADPRAFTLYQGVGRRGRAMGENIGSRQDIANRGVQRDGGATQNVKYPSFPGIGRGKGFFGAYYALIVDQDEVGKGSAGIDTNIGKPDGAGAIHILLPLDAESEPVEKKAYFPRPVDPFRQVCARFCVFAEIFESAIRHSSSPFGFTRLPGLVHLLAAIDIDGLA
jgi:hypothetical protein